MTIRSKGAALLTSAVFVAFATSAIAAPQFVAKQAEGEMSSSGLIGTKIQNSAGDKVGDVNYLVLDSSGTVSTVVIGVGGFLGVGEKNIGVPFKEVTRQDDSNGNAVFVLNATKDELNSAPAYEWTEKGAMQKMKEKAASAAETVKEKAAEATESVKEKTEDMTKADPPAADAPKP